MATEPTTPAATTDPKAEAVTSAWNNMNLTRQQSFVKNNPNFDMGKFGLSYAANNAPTKVNLGGDPGLVSNPNPATATVAPVEKNITPTQQANVDRVEAKKTAMETAPTPSDVAPNTTPGVKLETTKEVQTKQADYTDDSVQRLDEIKSNLEYYYKNSPQFFNDIGAFDKQFDYNKRSDTQKALLNTFFNQKKNESLYGGMTATQMADLYRSGKFNIDDISWMEMSDPALYAATKDAITASNTQITNQGTLDTFNGSTSPIITQSQTATEAADAAIKEYQDSMNTAEIKDYTDQISDLQGNINEYDEQITNIKNNIEAEYKDKGISKSLMNAIISDRTEKLMNQKNSDLIKLNTYTSKVNSAINLAKNNYDMSLQRNQAMQQDFNNQLTLFNTMYKIQQDKLGLESEAAKVVTNPITGESMQWNPATNRYDIPLGNGTPTSDNTSASSFTPPEGSGMRTDRHNNPTAMTIDVAKQGGLVEGVDYTKGDPFTGANGKTYYTARLTGDSMASTRKVIDKIGFTTASGNPRWSYLSELGVTNESRSKMSDTEKDGVIAKMYQHEGGKGTITAGGLSTGREFTTVQESAMDSFLDSNMTFKDEYNYLTKNGLSKADVETYKVDSTAVGVDGYNPDDAGIYQKYLAGGASKADYEQFGGKDKLSKQAGLRYKDSIAGRFDSTDFNVTDTFMDYYKTQSSAKKSDIDYTLGEVGKVISQTDTVLNYLDTHGVPSSMSFNDWTNYMTKIRSLQMSAKSEEIFNLGVLNGPDLDVLNDILPASRWTVAVLTDEEVKEAIISYRDTMVNNFNSANQTKGISYGYTGAYPKGTYENQYNNSVIGAGNVNQNLIDAQNALFGNTQ